MPHVQCKLQCQEYLMGIFFSILSCYLTHSCVEVCPYVLIISVPYKSTRAGDKEQVELRERLGYPKISESTFIKHILYLRIFPT